MDAYTCCSNSGFSQSTQSKQKIKHDKLVNDMLHLHDWLCVHYEAQTALDPETTISVKHFCLVRLI